MPVYAVFNNEELSEIAKLKEKTPKNVQKIKGIGKTKVEKYAKKLLDLYNTNNKNEKLELFD